MVSGLGSLAFGFWQSTVEPDSKTQDQKPKPTSFMSQDFLSNYKTKHQHPMNRLTHSIGIPMIVVSLPLFIFNWRLALTMFALGWILQFVGHAIEGNQPAFFKNPIYLLVGPLWLLRRAGTAIGIVKPHASK